MIEELSADYIIVGSGAIGMAFADILVTESDATMIIIDRFAKPGGHWNVAYPFVQLHQPAAYYGVSSKELSGGRIEQTGLNAGLGELSSGAEVSAYFDDVMRHQFLPSGRVQYFPMCDYRGDGRFVSKTNGKEYHATAKRKTVDATFLNTIVPSTHTPNFGIDAGVRFMPLNDLPKVTEAPDGYVVIGAGKTGIDACLWLLEQNVDADKITWIVSREAWLLDRKNTQMSEEFFFDTIGTQAAMFENVAESTSPEDLFERLEKCGYFLRIDENVTPQMFHAATVSKREIEELRRIKNVVRLGHVESIGTHDIKLVKGSIPTTPDTIHVDCSASALIDHGSKPVFQDTLITPQMIRPYQPVFSAALIAHLELNYENEEEKNRLSGPVPLPNADTDFIFFTAVAMINQYQWSQDKALQQWMAGNRLDGASSLISKVSRDDIDKQDVIKKLRKNAPLAAAKLFELQEGLTLSREWS
ncbi:MAG: hypothetical protein ACJAYC_000693 [Halieaceae bacterium]